MNKMKKIISNYILFIILITWIIYPHKNLAQTEISNNSIYLELLGNGVAYSINYDRMISEYVGARIGLSYIPEHETFFDKVGDTFIVPALINYFVGKGSSKLELGAGIIYIGGDKNTHYIGFFSPKRNSAIRGTATFGYRHQSADGGFVFRIGFTPFFGFGQFIPFGGISFGFCF
jgi:hypothetical protein